MLDGTKLSILFRFDISHQGMSRLVPKIGTKEQWQLLFKVSPNCTVSQRVMLTNYKFAGAPPFFFGYASLLFVMSGEACIFFFFFFFFFFFLGGEVFFFFFFFFLADIESCLNKLDIKELEKKTA